MSAALTVVEAEAALKAAKDAARQTRAEEARKQLKEVRARAKVLRAEHATVTAKITETETIVTSCRAEIASVQAAIIARQNHTHDDVLAEPEDFEEEIKALIAYRAEIINKMNRAQQRGGDRNRQAEIVLQMEHLQQVALNLKNIIENKGKFVGLTSGISYVG